MIGRDLLMKQRAMEKKQALFNHRATYLVAILASSGWGAIATDFFFKLTN